MRDVGQLIRQARERAGLSQVALATRAGTSQPTVAAYENGRSEPRLSTLERLLEAADHELTMSVQPKVRRGARPAARVAAEIAGLLRQGDEASSWRCVLDLVDDVRGSPAAGKASLIAVPPASTGNGRFDAAIAGVVEMLCDEAGLAWPSWTGEPDRFVEPWWFVSALEGFEAMALRDSPVELKHHGVFVSAGAFERV